ncbi:MAG: PAS domain-containing protein, partial [Snowella sp.]|nr:PAS domain-containing protein [Snowella sp.]
MQQIPLKLVLIVPFVLQIVGAVGLVGYLSYRSGQNAVKNLAHQVMNQASSRIQDRLNLVLQEQQRALEFSVQSIEQGNLNINNPEAVKKHLWQQINSFSFLTNNTFANDQGEEIGYIRFFSPEIIQQVEKITEESLKSGMIALGIVTPNSPNQRVYSLVDSQGRPRKTIYEMSIDPRTTSWYVDAKNRTEPGWSPIFAYRAIPSLGISMGSSIYDEKQKQQVILANLVSLAELGNFLKELDFSPSGQSFILDSSGYLVATSTGELPFIRQESKPPTRLAGSESQDPITQAIAVQLKQKYGNLATIEKEIFLTVPLDNQKLLAHGEPYRDKYGLNWLLVTVIPEADFMGEIQENNQRTVILCGITLLLVTTMGILTARWIVKPIRKLSLASEALSQGHWQGLSFEKSTIQELAVLVKSFQGMSVQLEKVFHESEMRFTNIFRISPYAMSIVNLNNSTYLTANDQFFALTGYSKEEVFGHTVDELKLMVKREQALEIYHLLQTQQGTNNYEMMLRTKSGEIKTILLSSELIELEKDVFVLAILNDISDRKKAEADLKESQHFIEQIANASPQILYILDPITWTNVYVNNQIIEILGYTPEEFQQGGSQIFLDILHPDDLSLLSDNMDFWQTAQDGEILTTEYRMRHKNGSWRWLRSRDVVFARDENQQVIKIIGTAQDFSDRKQQEEHIAQQNRREVLLREITHKIRQSLDLNSIFNTAVEEIRQFLNCDQVTIFRFKFNPYAEGEIVAESVVLDSPSVTSFNLQEHCFYCFNPKYILQYQQGHIQVVNDIYEMDFADCYIEFLEQLQIRSSITLPLLNNSQLWGLLSIHQFFQPRTWQDSEIDLLKQITDQLAIALQQANLYQQAQRELAAKNKLFEQLANELDQKKILLKEVHHRVKNNLQIMSGLLYLQFRNTPPAIQTLTEDYQDRIQSMALVHEQLYRSENLDCIDFHSYLTDLIH